MGKHSLLSRRRGGWRLACILEGVYSRYLGGAMGEVPENVHDFDVRIRGLLDRSNAYAAELA